MSVQDPPEWGERVRRLVVSRDRAQWCVTQVAEHVPKEERYKLRWMLDALRDMSVAAADIDEILDSFNLN